MQDFRKMKVWGKAHQVTLELYRVTRGFPKEERYALVDQIRRAAVSVCANLAEGCGRGSDPDVRRSLQIAMGSAKEMLLLSRDLQYLCSEAYARIESLAQEVRRMLAALIGKLRGDRL